MTSNQPYLIRAIHEWILDNDFTPHLLVNAEVPNVEVPVQFVKNGQIVLNVTPHAISNMLMDNEAISFSARFSGIVESIYIPIYAVRAIYASENGEGMVFAEADTETEEDSEVTIQEQPAIADDPSDDPKPPKNPPFLKVVK